MIPGVDEWDVIEPLAVVVNPHDEQGQGMRLPRSGPRRLKISTRSLPSPSPRERRPQMRTREQLKKWASLRFHHMIWLHGSFEVVPMDVDAEPEVTTKDDPKALESCFVFNLSW